MLCGMAARRDDVQVAAQRSSDESVRGEEASEALRAVHGDMAVSGREVKVRKLDRFFEEAGAKEADPAVFDEPDEGGDPAGLVAVRHVLDDLKAAHQGEARRRQGA